MMSLYFRKREVVLYHTLGGSSETSQPKANTPGTLDWLSCLFDEISICMRTRTVLFIIIIITIVVITIIIIV